MPMTPCFLEWKREQQRMEKPMGYCKDVGMLDRILKYEEGEASEDEIVALFQELVDTGLAWSLQGRYGREAERFITNGWVTAKPACQLTGECAHDV